MLPVGFALQFFRFNPKSSDLMNCEPKLPLANHRCLFKQLMQAPSECQVLMSPSRYMISTLLRQVHPATPLRTSYSQWYQEAFAVLRSRILASYLICPFKA